MIFSSDRDFNPIYGRLEWNHVYTRMGGIYLVPLALSTPSPFLGEDASGADSKDNTTTAASDKKKDDKKESAGMKVDTDNMYARIIKLPLDADNYYNFIQTERLSGIKAKEMFTHLIWIPKRMRWLQKTPDWQEILHRTSQSSIYRRTSGMCLSSLPERLL